MILSNASQGGTDTPVEVTPEGVIRSRRLRDRFSSGDLQAMVDLYRSGVTARRVAEDFEVNLRSVKRLLQQHGVRRDECGQRSVHDGLGETMLRRLVADFDSGTPKWQLAQQYGISQSSVKRLLRRYRAG